MAKKIKLKSKNIKFLNIPLTIIILNTVFLLAIWSRALSPKIINIANVKLQEISSSIILNNVKNNITSKAKANDLLTITKNKEGKIVTIDYNLENCYKILNTFSDYLISSINIIEAGDMSKYNYINEPFLNKNSKNGLEVLIPTGATFNNALFANLGPKIPAKIMFVGNIFVNLKTKVTSYGFNNALLEIYLTFNINNTVVVPMSKKANVFADEILLTAKAVQGRVPFTLPSDIESEGVSTSLGR